MLKKSLGSAAVLGAVTALAAAPVSVSAEGLSARAVANLTNNCYSCHGPGGRSPGTIPGLAKLKASRIASDMKDFRSGAQESTVMGRMAKAYTDEEIEAIAHFIADLNNPPQAK